MLCLLCLGRSPQEINTVSLLDKWQEIFRKEQDLNSRLSISSSEVSASGTEWKTAADEPSPSVMPLDPKDGSAVSADVPERIVLKISSGTVVPDQKTPSKVKKHAGLKSEGSGKRDGARTEIQATESYLLPNQAVSSKKMSTGKDSAVAPGVKSQSKVKKHRKSDGFCSMDGSSTQVLAAGANLSLKKLSESKKKDLSLIHI